MFTFPFFNVVRIMYSSYKNVISSEKRFINFQNHKKTFEKYLDWNKIIGSWAPLISAAQIISRDRFLDISLDQSLS